MKVLLLLLMPVLVVPAHFPADGGVVHNETPPTWGRTALADGGVDNETSPTWGRTALADGGVHNETLPAGLRTVLAQPQLEKCRRRPKHWFHNDHWYYFSWDQPVTAYHNNDQSWSVGDTASWLEARNFCRVHCMDTVSIDTETEHEIIGDFMDKRRVATLWTSGRRCDAPTCDGIRALQPVEVNGWFWTGSETKIPPTNSTPKGWTNQPWSSKGLYGPQPDNAEFRRNSVNESCLSVATNVNDVGPRWIDLACHHRRAFLCEDSDLLLRITTEHRQPVT